MTYHSGKESTIELLGIVGIVLTGACTIQHLLLVRYAYNWIPAALVFIDVFVLVSFVLFYKMKAVSAPLLIASVALLVIEQAVFLVMGGILWLAVLLTVFAIAAVALLYIQELNVYLKEYQRDQQSEAAFY